MSENRPHSPNGLTYAELLRWHLEKGTRPIGPRLESKKWKPAMLARAATAAAAAMPELAEKIVIVDDHLAGNWLRLASHQIVRRVYHDVILSTLFSNSPPPGSWHAIERDKLDRLYSLAIEEHAARVSAKGEATRTANNLARQGDTASLSSRERLSEPKGSHERGITQAVAIGANGPKLDPASAPAAAQGDLTLLSYRPSNIPFISLDRDFVGRAEELGRIDAVLSIEDSAARGTLVFAALHGTGGVGKTRLAVEYALSREARFSAVLFVRADSPAAFASSVSYLANAEVLDLSEQHEPELTRRLSAVARWLNSNSGWLLIVDSVNDPDSLNSVMRYVARLRGGRVITTGRLSQYPAGVEKVEVAVLPPRVGAAFLLQRTKHDRIQSGRDPSVGSQLAKELGGLPLRLEHAAAYVSAARISLSDYLAMWFESRNAALKNIAGMKIDSDLEADSLATWSTTFERLTAPARRLLQCLAYFTSEPIPEMLVRRLDGQWGIQSHAAMAELYLYSLIARSSFEEPPCGPTFVLHPLVRDFILRTTRVEQAHTALMDAYAWMKPSGERSLRLSDLLLDPACYPVQSHLHSIVTNLLLRAPSNTTLSSEAKIEQVYEVHRYLSHEESRKLLAETIVEARRTVPGTRVFALLLASLAWCTSGEGSVDLLLEAAEVFCKLDDMVNFGKAIEELLPRPLGRTSPEAAERKIRLERLLAVAEEKSPPAAGWIKVVLSGGLGLWESGFVEPRFGGWKKWP